MPPSRTTSGEVFRWSWSFHGDALILTNIGHMACSFQREHYPRSRVGNLDFNENVELAENVRPRR